MNPILLDLPMPILTPRLLLRNPLPGDGADLQASIQESYRDLHPWVTWADRFGSPEDAEVQARRAYAQWVLREDLRISIYERSGKIHLGSVQIRPMNWRFPSFQIGYWIRSSFSGQGFVTEATHAATVYAFRQLKARRLEIRCDVENFKSKRIIEKLGFQLEGQVRSSTRSTLVYSRVDLSGLPGLELSW